MDATQQIVLFYDDHCPICTASADHIRRRDWRGHVRLMPVSDTASLAQFGITPEQAQARLQAIIAATGVRVDGVAALYEVAKRLPLWWPVVPLLWTAVRFGLGQRLYDVFAARRLLVSRLICTGSCPLPHASPEDTPYRP